MLSRSIQYSSRAASHIARQKQIHKLRHVIAELAKALPEERRRSSEIRELASYGCLTRMHVVRLLAPALEGEDHSKDIERAPWTHQFDPIEGFILHEAAAGEMVSEG